MKIILKMVSINLFAVPLVFIATNYGHQSVAFGAYVFGWVIGMVCAMLAFIDTKRKREEL